MSALPPDPHLQAALRHAPDADRAAPPALSAQILAAAHRSAAQQAAPAAAGDTRPGFRAWWNRQWTAWTSAGPRAALATLLMAGFVGLLWRGETPGPAVDGTSPIPTVSAPPAPPAPPQQSAAATPNAVSQSLPASPTAPAAARAAAPTPLSAAKGVTAPTAPVAAPAAAAAVPPALSTAPTASTAPSPETTPAQPQMRVALAPSLTADEPSAAAGKAAPAAAPSDVNGLADAQGAIRLRAMRPQAARSAELAEPAQASTAAAAPAQALQRPAAAAPAPQHARLLAAPAVVTGSALPTTPAASVSKAIAAPPWAERGAADRWQRAGSVPGAVNPAALLALASVTQGRWLPAPGAQAAEGAVLLLGLRGDTEQGRLWLEAGAVLWCPAAGPCQRAVLAEGEVQGLRPALLR
jgi:hypothetical protein